MSPPILDAREMARLKQMGRQAGALVMDYYRQDLAVFTKAWQEPVTAADRAANGFLVNELQRLFPHDAIVAEESPLPTVPETSRRCWFVDPLDGTKEFLARNGQFCVMLGLAQHGRPVFGLVYRPEGECLYYALRGQGAFLETPRGARRLRVSKTAALSGLRCLVSRSHPHLLVDRILKRAGFAEVTPYGSGGLKIGRIAEAEADVYLSYSEPGGGGMKLWDICAPQIILEEAGGSFSDLAGAPYPYDARALKVERGILASNGSAHTALVELIQPFMAAR